MSRLSELGGAGRSAGSADARAGRSGFGRISARLKGMRGGEDTYTGQENSGALENSGPQENIAGQANGWGLGRLMERFVPSHYADLLPNARLGGPMLWVIAIMVALMVLAAGMGLTVANLGAAAQSDLDGGVTVQILEPDPALRDRQAERAVTALEQMPQVRELRRVPQAELAALIEPWLGDIALGQPASSRGDLDQDAVPIPALIDVRLEGEADEAQLEAMRSALNTAAPDAKVDAQAAWLSPVFSAIGTLRWLAVLLIAMLGVTSAAAVWLASRNALNANRETIEIVHLLGGTDRQIANIFQKSILIDAAGGGLIGLVSGALMLAFLGAQFAVLESGMVAGGDLGIGDWLLIALIPVAAIVMALVTARQTVLWAVRKML
jgi:cell division transport system permease protein